MKNSAKSGVFRLGKTAKLLFTVTAVMTLIQAIYILYLAMSVNCGEYPMYPSEIQELIQSEAISLPLSIGVTFLIDAEEKKMTRK